MSYTFVITLVPSEQLPSQDDPQYYEELYSGSSLLMTKFQQEGAIPGDPIYSRIDGYSIGGGLHGLILGQHTRYPREKMMEALQSESFDSHDKFEVSLLPLNSLPADEFSPVSATLADHVSAVITPEGEWTNLMSDDERNDWLKRDQEYVKELIASGLKFAGPGWNEKMKEFYADYPAKERLKNLVAKYPNTIAVVGSVHF
jgi:hypothetical protein